MRQVRENQWRRWLSPPGSTASCAASVPASKAASRTSSVPLEAAAATGKGWQGFQQYVHLSVVAYNLLVLARLRLPT